MEIKKPFGFFQTGRPVNACWVPFLIDFNSFLSSENPLIHPSPILSHKSWVMMRMVLHAEALDSNIEGFDPMMMVMKVGDGEIVRVM